MEKSRVKNAPLTLPSDREPFVRWATQGSDGGVAAGWQSLHRLFLAEAPEHVLRKSAARLISLARRAQGRTLEQVAASASVRIADVLALEDGQDVPGEAIERVAVVLQLNADVLVQLLRGDQIVDQTLVRAATEFVARLEPSQPLDAKESAALDWFRDALASHRSGPVEAS
jgi:hypothetical protein